MARHIPNLISLARILFLLPLWWLFTEQRYFDTLLLFAVAGASDGVDGFLARRYGWTSRLGGFLDPIADKLMMMTAYLWCGWTGVLPWWLVGLVLGRDLVIVGGAVVYYRLVGSLEMAPTVISKVNTLLQILLALVAILVLSGITGPGWLFSLLMVLVTVTTLWSGADYVLRWGHKAYREKKG